MRQYLDISHFRAPYKNVAVSGFGALPDPNLGLPVDNPYATMFEQKNGMNYWTGDAKKIALEAMKTSHFQPVAGQDDIVGIIGLTAEEQAVLAQNPSAPLAFRASDWINQKLAEGKAIIAPVFLLAPIEGPGRQIMAIPATDKDRLRAASSTMIAGILVEPGIGAGMSTLLKAGLIAGGVIAGAVVLGAAMKKKKMTANRRRRRH